MPTYAAFLRGIMPTNPNMRNEKLRGVFEGLGFTKVQTVISSGNVIFEVKNGSGAKPGAKSETKPTAEDVTSLEQRIEKALAEKLGIKSPAYVRSHEELAALIAKNPFKKAQHGRQTYLIVSFLKKAPREIYTALDLTKGPTPDFMSALDRKYGKDVTTRTWKTVQRIVAKMKVEEK